MSGAEPATEGVAAPPLALMAWSKSSVAMCRKVDSSQWRPASQARRILDAFMRAWKTCRGKGRKAGASREAPPHLRKPRVPPAPPPSLQPQPVTRLDVRHECLGPVARVHDAELREDARVRVLEADALLEELDELLPVPRLLVVVDELLEVVGRHDDVQAAHLQQRGGWGRQGGSSPRPVAGPCRLLPSLPCDSPAPA